MQQKDADRVIRELLEGDEEEKAAAARLTEVIEREKDRRSRYTVSACKTAPRVRGGKTKTGKSMTLELMLQRVESSDNIGMVRRTMIQEKEGHASSLRASSSRADTRSLTTTRRGSQSSI